ncbi:MAG TPA: cell division protein ZapE [Methyloceanibacter sp.]
MQEGPLQRYRQMVLAGELAPDTAQELAAEKLQLLANRLAQYSEPRLGDLLPFARRRRSAPEGLNLYGGVGRGKTMLLDLFFETVHYAPKRRVHFQEFMAEAHEAIERGRKAAADPIASAAEEIGSDAALLCFDELEVTDIADAMILGRLFQQLFARNVVMVATSNTAPRDLYRDGLNRQLFTPFIKLIEERMETHELESAKDYRLEKLQGSDLYLTPADVRAGAAMDASFRKLTGRMRGEPQTLRHKGRSITVPEAALGVARFTFADLCVAPLGPLDYQRIAHAFHTLMIEEIPVLGSEQRNEARRLITLIDVLYDNGVGLIASAAAEPQALYVVGTGSESFARTASRLMEMRSDAYLAERHRRGGHAAEPG